MRTATIRIIRVSPRLYQSPSLKDGLEDPAKIFSSGRKGGGDGSDFAIPRINIPRLPEELLLSLH